MSTRGQFNTKNPTIKRILKEASELANNASADYHAEPLEDNLFEWHFTLRGPPEPSPYAGGIYHGRIILPPAYPLRPPSFRFVTPTGRFEVNREICLSISGHHEETWQPAWGIRTALVAIRSFMDTDAKGQVGGIDCTEAARKKMASESVAHRCASCGKTNAEIMQEREELVKEMAGNGKPTEEEVPEELRFAYREDLEKQDEAESSSKPVQTRPDETAAKDATPSESNGGKPPAAAQPFPAPSPAQAPASTRQASGAATAATRAAPPPTRTGPAALQRRQQANEGVPAWVDKAIYGILAALAFMILRKVF